MRKAASGHDFPPRVEPLEARTLLSVSPFLVGQQTFGTRTVLTVDAGTLGQAITFHVTVFSKLTPWGPVDLYSRGKMFEEVGVSETFSPDPRFSASQGTFTIPAGALGAERFGVGPHLVRAVCEGREPIFLSSSTLAGFWVKRPQLVTQPSGVGIATVQAGSGPALQPGQTATVQYDAYLAATYRLFDSSESQTPDTFSFTVDANPEQVIPGLDAGVIGMQAGETRAIYIPRSLSRGLPGSQPTRQPRANLVYLVTLVSIG